MPQFPRLYSGSQSSAREGCCEDSAGGSREAVGPVPGPLGAGRGRRRDSAVATAVSVCARPWHGLVVTTEPLSRGLLRGPCQRMAAGTEGGFWLRRGGSGRELPPSPRGFPSGQRVCPDGVCAEGWGVPGGGAPQLCSQGRVQGKLPRTLIFFSATHVWPRGCV